jgi:2-polyprenyl-3-methyl-5-hydroxy-6-metoxy-1,4-benzoquinol methylase
LYGEHYFVGAQSEYQNYVAEEPAHRRQGRRYLRRIAMDRQDRGAILDVGCAAGFFLDEARVLGWSVSGIEVSGYASEYARSTLGLPVRTGAFPADLPPKASFDVVTFFNVLEHLAEPRAIVARLEEIVRPGGLVVIETWDWKSTIARMLGMGWHQYNARHVPAYYAKRAIALAFPAPRWEVVRYSTATKWISVRRATEIIARQNHITWLTRALSRTAGHIVSRIDVPYRLGDLIWIVLKSTQPQ